MVLRLNSDIGESFGQWTMGMDAAVMAHIDQANIACGFHAGDPEVMLHTLQLACEHNVMVGAHPAYPDLVGFGRRSMQCSTAEIIAFLLYQIAALDGMARSIGTQVSYVKPHGALYNDMMANEKTRQAVMAALARYHCPLDLMLLATPQAEQHLNEAKQWGLGLQFEAFADRCYTDDGKLQARSEVGAVHDREKTLAQVEQLKRHGTVITASGKTLAIHADTLCVHGDNPQGVAAIAEIKARLHA